MKYWDNDEMHLDSEVNKPVSLFVSIHGVVELVEIPNNKSQMTNKYQ